MHPQGWWEVCSRRPAWVTMRSSRHCPGSVLCSPGRAQRASREGIGQAHVCAPTRILPPHLPLEASYLHFLLPSSHLQAATPALPPEWLPPSLPPCGSKIQGKGHKSPRRPAPQAQPSPAWSLECSPGLPPTGEVREAQTGVAPGEGWGAEVQWPDPSPGWSSGS